MSLNNLTASFISALQVTIKHNCKSNKSLHNKFVHEIAKLMASKSIIQNLWIAMINNRKYITYNMPQYNGRYLITNIKNYYRVSGYTYCSILWLKKIRKTCDNAVVSTIKGVMDLDQCLEMKIGGKLIFCYSE